MGVKHGENKEGSEWTCKPGSVPVVSRKRPTGDGHFSRKPIARLLKQPTRKSITDRTGPCVAPGGLKSLGPALLPVWPCSRWGLPSQAGHPACW